MKCILSLESYPGRFGTGLLPEHAIRTFLIGKLWITVMAFVWHPNFAFWKVSSSKPEENKIRQEDLTKIISSAQKVQIKQETIESRLSELKR